MDTPVKQAYIPVLMGSFGEASIQRSMFTSFNSGAKLNKRSHKAIHALNVIGEEKKISQSSQQSLKDKKWRLENSLDCSPSRTLEKLSEAGSKP